MALNLPLSTAESALLSRLREHAALQTTEQFVHDGDKLHVIRRNNVDALVSDVKVMSEIQKDGKMSEWRRYFGSIDPITAARFAQESRLKIGTKEFAAYAKKRLNDDYRKFKA